MLSIIGIVFAVMVCLLLIGGGIMAVSNWHLCSQSFNLIDQNGNIIRDPQGNPMTACNNGNYVLPPDICAKYKVVPVTVTPPLQCLLNPFPGGL